MGSSTDSEVGGFYYVMNGSGQVTIGAETAPINAGDAVPINLNDKKSFDNNGTAPLELMIVGVVRDANRKMDLVPRRGAAGTGAPARGGRGRGNQ